MPSWDPARYLRFAEPRARPFTDLLARVGAVEPEGVVDLGCGPGTLTRTLAGRWPTAAVTGVDSSAAMITHARSGSPDGRPAYRLGDLRDYRLPPGTDVLVTNATLQWVPDHLGLLRPWLDALAPGGWLALQVPGNADAPEHVAIEELAGEPAYRAFTAGAADRPRGAEPGEYLAALSRPGVEVDVWETTYLHLLAGPDPVFDWLSGTGLRPVLDALDADPALSARFADELRRRLRALFPARPAGVVFPFRRVFAVAHRVPG